jgi:hypothetical protein
MKKRKSFDSSEDTAMPYKTTKALLYALFIWLIGFIWGSIVFMTPRLRTIAPIRFVSINPAISFPILLILGHSYLHHCQ